MQNMSLLSPVEKNSLKSSVMNPLRQKLPCSRKVAVINMVLLFSAAQTIANDQDYIWR